MIETHGWLIPRGNRLLIIPDTLADKRFAKNPYVRFYAGVPLITLEGEVIEAEAALIFGDKVGALEKFIGGIYI